MENKSVKNNYGEQMENKSVKNKYGEQMENKSVKNKYREQNENKYAKTTTLEIFRSLKKITCNSSDVFLITFEANVIRTLFPAAEFGRLHIL